MPVDISIQTRDLVARIDEQQAAIGISEVIALAERAEEVSAIPDGFGTVSVSPPKVKRSWWRNLGVATTAVAVVFVAIGGVALISRLIGSNDAADPTTTIVGDPTPDAGVWSPVTGALQDGESDVWDDTLFDVAATPYGFIGTSGQGLWISQDGTEWERYARDAIEFDGGESFARIASSALGVLVVNAMGSSPQAWYSSDGTTWQEVELQDLLSYGSVRIVANDELMIGEFGNQVATSTNGIDWENQPVDPEMFSSGWGAFTTLEATPFGFVAGGSHQGHPAIWRSTDGSTWTKAEGLEGTSGRDDTIWDVAGSDLGIVAVSTTGAGWFSTDGDTWTQVIASAPGDEWLHGVAGASDTGFIVATSVHIPEGEALNRAVRVLVSADGKTWTLVETPQRSTIMREAVPLGDGFLIVTEGAPSPVHTYGR